jgi:hypothetical protein
MFEGWWYGKERKRACKKGRRKIMNGSKRG